MMIGFLAMVLLMFPTITNATPRFTREQVERESLEKRAEQTKAMIIPKSNWRQVGYHVGCDMCESIAKKFYAIRQDGTLFTPTFNYQHTHTRTRITRKEYHTKTHGHL